ncbi:MAG: hypothetical protein M3Q56_00650 [Bacteroidota bacterium]|nr:hypothetical protein [Bacteroidota bacterium]
MAQIHTIIQLLEKEFSLRAISTQVDLSRLTVTFYATRLKSAPYSFEGLCQLTDEDLASIGYVPEVAVPLSVNARR